LLRRFAPRNDSGAVSLRASRKGGVAISEKKKAKTRLLRYRSQ
jgi:hypothetical protein